MAKIWRPVKDGNYGLHGLVGIDADGAEIDMCAIDPHGIAWPIEETLPSSLRLCELVEDDAPAPVPLPDSGVLYVMRKALERHRNRMEELAGMGWYKDSTPTDNEIARVDAALAWLNDAQGKHSPSPHSPRPIPT